MEKPDFTYSSCEHSTEVRIIIAQLAVAYKKRKLPVSDFLLLLKEASIDVSRSSLFRWIKSIEGRETPFSEEKGS